MPSSRMMRRIAAKHLVDQDGRQPFRGLVEQQERRVGHERASDRQHLLLAAGELVAHVGAPLPQAGKHRVDAREAVHKPGRATAVRFSSTVSERKMLRSCGTQPTPAACARASGGSRVTSRPPRRTLPARRRVTPTIELSSVVLPIAVAPKHSERLAHLQRQRDTPASTVAAPYPLTSPSIFQEL